jgi:putative ABC transport system ATP-binding protein
MTTTLPTSPAALPAAEPSDAETCPAVELVDVTKRYSRRGVPALDGISAAFPRASLTAVMGLSGSGKSTLLQCAAGLDRASSGRIRLGGTELTKLNRRALSKLRRRQVGFVFQSLNLVPTLTVAENIALPLRLDHRRVDHAVVAGLAERVGVGALLRRLPHTLSGGQQQRVAIARALITAPDVVFADEPTAALDPHTSAEVRSLLRWAVDELGQTVVVVTHEPTLASWADRALLLHAGRVVTELVRPDAAELESWLHRLGTEQR